ncbi:MAG TPA: class I SAM-dependent methyltransferase [Mycobacteriales bacterium]|nr:class I SAM-dependent methyltransferase [Mycobacteriales bacterium]
MTAGAGWGQAFRAGSADAMGAYRDTLLEAVFRPWARLMLDVVQPEPGEQLLDVATGPGTVAQAAAVRLGPSGRVTACDISPAMLEIARATAPQPDAAPIEYVESPAVPLSAATESHDIVTCQQGLQFMPDRVAALDEMSRVLRPGGRLGVAVWATIEQCPSMAALERALRDQLGDEIADRYRSGPWGLSDGSSLAELLHAAGFAEVQVDKRALTAVFPGGVAQLSASLAASGVAAEVASMPAEDRAALDQRIAHHLSSVMAGEAVEAVMHSNIATAVKK